VVEERREAIALDSRPEPGVPIDEGGSLGRRVPFAQFLRDSHHCATEVIVAFRWGVSERGVVHTIVVFQDTWG
jgi:hypothetical protein